MNKDLLGAIVFIFGAMLFVFLVVTAYTIQENGYNHEVCRMENRRIDYIFPARPLACWLSEDINKGDI